MGTGGLQPRLFYPERLSIKMEGQIRSVPDTKMLKKCTSTKPPLQHMIKELLKKGKKKRERSTGMKGVKWQ